MILLVKLLRKNEWEIVIMNEICEKFRIIFNIYQVKSY